MLSAETLQKWVDRVDWSARCHQRAVGPDEVYTVFNSTGISDTVCTAWAVELLRIFPTRVKLYGFFASQNPESRIAREFMGHDFAVLDDRFIIDPWLTRVEVLVERAVFDLESPSDASIVADLYGKRACWQPVFITLGSRASQLRGPQTDGP